MTFELRKGLTFCETEGRVIFLDVIDDRYFLAPPEMGEALLSSSCGNDLGPEQMNALRPLVARGYLFETSTPNVAPTIYRRPRLSVLDTAPPSHPPSMLRQAVIAQLEAAVHLRFRPLHVVLDSIAADRKVERPRLDAGALDFVQRSASAFKRAGRYFPMEGKCLRRSIAFARHLRRYDVICDVVIGVRAFPFAAHCWAQSNEAVLNDHFEDVRQYTPILVA